MRDKAKTVSKELVSVVTATAPRTSWSFGEVESAGEDDNSHGEKEKRRGRRVGKTEM